MLTGVNVTLHTSFGRILGKTEKAKMILVNESEAGVAEQRCVMARAISIASDCIHTGKELQFETERRRWKSIKWPGVGM
jgi:hypothetical protein